MQVAITSTFPERLKTILDETGIRQIDLCEKAGIGKSAMSQYLHGAFIPKQAKLSAIAEVLGVSERWLMGYDVPRLPITYNSDDSECMDEYMEMIAPDEAMQSAHIPKGARVLLRRVDEKETLDGEIVGICINSGKPQLRILHKDGERILATATDPGYVPQVFDERDIENGKLQICGVVERVEIKF